MRFFIDRYLTLGEFGWMTVLNLLYLGFLFFPAFFPWAQQFEWQLPTLLSVLVFLPLYAMAYTRAQARLWIGLAIAALGFLLFPLNPFSNTYIIYSAGVFGLCHPAKRSIGVAIGVMLAFTLYAFTFERPWIPVGVTWVVGLGVLTSNLLLAGHMRKNAVLKLNQDEIQRLARTAERERIARDLHDLLGHSLSVIALKAELARRLIERDPARARLEIEGVEAAAREALSETRRAVVGMRAAGLAPELARAKWVLLGADVQVNFVGDAELRLPPQVETVVALALREAVTNILRHAKAQHCEIRLEKTATQVILLVRDDGVGTPAPHGNGLTGMAERAASLNGSLQVRARLGGGTELRLTLELEPDQEAAAAPQTAAR